MCKEYPYTKKNTRSSIQLHVVLMNFLKKFQQGNTINRYEYRQSNISPALLLQL